MNTDVAAGYLAAMIDGEGTVGNRPRVVMKRWITVRKSASIVNTERSIIDRIIICCEVLGIRHTVTYADRPGCKRIWHVRFSSREAFIRLNRLPFGSDLKRAKMAAVVASYKHEPLDPETLRSLYWDEGKTFQEIAALIGTTYGRVQHAFKKHGIPIRTMAQAVRRGWAKHKTPTS